MLFTCTYSICMYVHKTTNPFKITRLYFLITSDNKYPSFIIILISPFILDQFGELRANNGESAFGRGVNEKCIRKSAWRRCVALRCIRENRRTEDGGKLRKCASQTGESGGRELNRVHMSPKRACHRVEKRRYIWRASICRSPLIWQHLHTAYSLWAIYSLANSPLLAFGHQCVWLTLLVAPLTPDYISICIHSRTSLSPTARLRSLVLLSLPRSTRVPAFFILLLRRRLANDFRFSVELSRGCTRVIFLHAGMCTGCRCDVDRRRWFGRELRFCSVAVVMVQSVTHFFFFLGTVT